MEKTSEIEDLCEFLITGFARGFEGRKLRWCLSALSTAFSNISTDSNHDRLDELITLIAKTACDPVDKKINVINTVIKKFCISKKSEIYQLFYDSPDLEIDVKKSVAVARCFRFCFPRPVKKDDAL